MSHAPPVTCPYCGKPAVFRKTSLHVYGNRDYGPIWECAPCDARVGCHRGQGDRPLGSLANAEDRRRRREAHQMFDPLWQAKMKRDGVSKGKARGAAYRWLAGQLGMDTKDCHISMMHGDDLDRVISVCEPHTRKLHDRGGRHG